MSTRGVIARATVTGFNGRYHHWDSYPSALGATLYALYNGHFQKDLPAMLAYLIDEHPAGWSTINERDFTKAPGFDRPGPQCYCHGARTEVGWECTESNTVESGCEWAYVFRTEHGKTLMDVLSSYRPDGAKMIGMFGCGDPAARWYRIATVDLNAADPDWKAIDNLEPVLN